MNLLQATLTIAGTPFDETGRITKGLVIDSWGWDLDGDTELEFHETNPGVISPSYKMGSGVNLTFGSSMYYGGQIVSVHPSQGIEDWTFGYRCQGYKYLLNQIPVTATDFSGTMLFNDSPQNLDTYVAANAGLSVGAILGDVITQHASAMAVFGIAADSVTNTQLSSLTLVPPEPVYIAGSRLAQAMETLLQKWARNVVLFINGNGNLRFLDTTLFNDVTITEGVDTVMPVRFNRDVSTCNTNVRVRGKGKIYPAYVSIGSGTMTAAWTGTQQSAWKLTDFTAPGDAYDHGTIASGNILSPTTVRVTSVSTTAWWSTNFWSTRQAWIYLSWSLGSAGTFSEQRPITANTALTTSAIPHTSDITLAYDLENAGSSAYDQYKIIGSYAPLGGTTAFGGNDRNNVWRLFNIVTPGNQIEDHLVPSFPTQVPFIGYTGSAVAMTNFPSAAIVGTNSTLPATFKVMPQTGQVLFDEPIVKANNSLNVLNVGGGSVVAPADVYMLLAYSRGALQASYPPDSLGVTQYGGTAYTQEGLARVYTVDVDSWVYAGNTVQMQQYAQMLWESMSDTIRTGDVTVKGAYINAFNPGIRISIAGSGYTTGEENAKVPVRNFKLRFDNGAGGLLYTSTMGCSSRRNTRTGDRAYVHPTQYKQIGNSLDMLGGLSKVMQRSGMLQNAIGFQGANMSSPIQQPDLGGMTPDMSSMSTDLSGMDMSGMVSSNFSGVSEILNSLSHPSGGSSEDDGSQ